MSRLGSLARRLARVRVETLKLVVLVIATIVAFAMTRAFANRTIEAGLTDAAEWHTLGRQALEAGEIDDAVEAFRRALGKDRGNRVYGLALAEAMSLSSQPNRAQPVLMTLRETAPEDPDINLELGRLAARNGEMGAAVRYYQSALYAPPRDADSPRRIRLELAQLLLRYDERERALSELIAAVDDLGDEPGRRVLVANLMLEAGDAQHALEQFQQELQTSPQNRDALAGAGTAAFRLGDFADSARYLQSAADTPELVEMRSTAELVLSRDPMGPRVRGAERRRRLLANLEHVDARLEECAPRQSPPDVEPESLTAAIGEARAQARRFQNDQDVIEDGIAVAYRAAQYIESRCEPVTPLDRALLIIGERRSGGVP